MLSIAVNSGDSASEYETKRVQNGAFSSSFAERDALRKIVLLSWGVGAVGAGNVPGGAAGGGSFGILRLGDGRVPSREYEGRSKPGRGALRLEEGWFGIGRLGVGGLGVGETGVGGLGAGVGVEWARSRHCRGRLRSTLRSLWGGHCVLAPS
jgi:hypothetical protein